MNRRFERSTQLFEFGSQYLSGGVSSNFRYLGYGESPVPLYYSKGEGCRITDVDGYSYIDYALANGPVILGHAPKPVLDKVENSLSTGQLFAGQTELEAELAKKIVDIVPCAELVRFASSGTEAIQAAVRLAKAYTERSKIVKFEGHYHGWTDNVFVSVNPSLDEAGEESSPRSVAQTPGQSISALEDVITLPWNNLEILNQLIKSKHNEVAAIIMEPINCNTGAIMPLPGYLEGVRKLCSEYDIVLIFDEVITGFRVALEGAQGLLGITPDLAVFAKALAAGFPLAAIAGKRSIMDLLHTKSVMHGGTYNANVLVVAACLATIQELEANNCAAYKTMKENGRLLIDGLIKLLQKYNKQFEIPGLETVFHPLILPNGIQKISNYREYLHCDRSELNDFYAKLQTAGTRVTARGTWFLSTAHDKDDIEETLEQVERVLKE